MNRTPHITDREQTARRLLKSFAKNSYDSEVDPDRDAPPADDLPCVPVHRSSLYGTYLWDGLTAQQRIELTKHQFAGLASTGVWFESPLMRGSLINPRVHRSAGLRPEETRRIAWKNSRFQNTVHWYSERSCPFWTNSDSSGSPACTGDARHI